MVLDYTKHLNSQIQHIKEFLADKISKTQQNTDLSNEKASSIVLLFGANNTNKWLEIEHDDGISNQLINIIKEQRNIVTIKANLIVQNASIEILNQQAVKDNKND